jgi:hypothetical protein
MEWVNDELEKCETELRGILCANFTAEQLQARVLWSNVKTFLYKFVEWIAAYNSWNGFLNRLRRESTIESCLLLPLPDISKDTRKHISELISAFSFDFQFDGQVTVTFTTKTREVNYARFWFDLDTTIYFYMGYRPPEEHLPLWYRERYTIGKLTDLTPYVSMFLSWTGEAEHQTIAELLMNRYLRSIGGR